jgi:hypothetical protein
VRYPLCLGEVIGSASGEKLGNELTTELPSLRITFRKAERETRETYPQIVENVEKAVLILFIA